MGAASGGPAFPVVEIYVGRNPKTKNDEVMSAVHAGQSLRDFLVSQVAGSVYREWASRPVEEIARRAVEYADALLAARGTDTQ